jgi:hypothetical protein
MAALLVVPGYATLSRIHIVSKALVRCSYKGSSNADGRRRRTAGEPAEPLIAGRRSLRGER